MPQNYIGCYFDARGIAADAFIVFEEVDNIVSKFKKTQIKLKFDKKYSSKQLKDFGLKLDNYYRNKKSWMYELKSREELKDALEGLSNNGFQISQEQMWKMLARLV